MKLQTSFLNRGMLIMFEGLRKLVVHLSLALRYCSFVEIFPLSVASILYGDPRVAGGRDRSVLTPRYLGHLIYTVTFFILATPHSLT